MKFYSWDTRSFFLHGMRLFFGVWLLYVGAMKWAMGTTAFSGVITEAFDKTWSPHPLNLCLAYLIMVAEPVLALWLLSGKCARGAWSLTACLMFLLTFGQTMLMKPDVAFNWQYVVLTLLCAALSDPIEHCCGRQSGETKAA